MRKKRILRIYNKIAQITQKGKGSFMEYYNYIDDVINNGEYSILQDVYINYFDVDIRLYKSITIMKQKTWNLIGISVNPLFQNRFVDYCEDNGVYQVGKYFYDSSNNEQLGEFTLVTRASTINYLGITYSYYPDTIYYRNTDLYKKFDEPKDIILEVLIGSDPAGVKAYLNDPTMVLLDKYKRGVDILVSQNPSINQYVENNYIDNYFE